MNNKKAKRLRKMLSPENPISKRSYRRAKKLYSSLPEESKVDFLMSIEAMIAD